MKRFLVILLSLTLFLSAFLPLTVHAEQSAELADDVVGKLDGETDRVVQNVTVAGKECMLTFKEYELLKYLVLNRGIVLTRDRLMDTVWGTDYEGGSRTVDMHIKTLRQKLGDAAGSIKTVVGIGYRMEVVG